MIEVDPKGKAREVVVRVESAGEWKIRLAVVSAWGVVEVPEVVVSASRPGSSSAQLRLLRKAQLRFKKIRSQIWRISNNSTWPLRRCSEVLLKKSMLWKVGGSWAPLKLC